MPLYRVVLRGENFLLDLTGEPELLGFDATHFIKAGSEAEARQVATINTRKARHLYGKLLNTQENPTRLECRSVERVRWPFGSRRSQYRFWPMGEEAAGEEPS